MKLKSMKISAAEREKRNTPAETSATPDAYPWGLSLNLENDTLDKLGLELPAVGDELVLVARVKVTSVSSREGEGESKARSASLQITDMAVGGEKSDATDAAATLYGG